MTPPEHGDDERQNYEPEDDGQESRIWIDGKPVPIGNVDVDNLVVTVSGPADFSDAMLYEIVSVIAYRDPYPEEAE